MKIKNHSVPSADKSVQVDERSVQVGERFVQVGERFVQVDERFVQVDERSVQADGRSVQADGRSVQADGRFVQADEIFVPTEEGFVRDEEKYVKSAKTGLILLKNAEKTIFWMGPTAEAAFTMIEIAIALAVIAFALVAIIGVLPTGMNVQKDNREETIINQDGPFLLELIRSGNTGVDYLTNYVDSITVHTVGTNGLGNPVDFTIIHTNDPSSPPLPIDGSMTNGAKIIGLLGTPKYEPQGIYLVTNTVVAKVRALTGSATEQGMANTDFAFTYLLTPEVTQFMASQVTTNSTNFNDLTLTNATITVDTLKKEWMRVVSRERNSHEIRLTFRWPVFQNDQTGPNRQSFRALASGGRTNIDGLWFFQSQSFAAAQQPPAP